MSMQQPTGPNQHKSADRSEKLFDQIHVVKQRLYGSNRDHFISGPHDLATATVEVNRYATKPILRLVARLLLCLP